MTSEHCGCGKRAWVNRDEADQFVVTAKIKAGLRGNQRRREQRTYPCPLRPNLWHITSQPDTGSGPPPLPDYPTTDDEAAHEFISAALRHHHDPTWQALISEQRCEQTLRVLAALHHDLLAQGEERAARAESAKHRRRIGEATFADVDRATAELEEWKARVARFRSVVLARMIDAKQAVRKVNAARAHDDNRVHNETHREALRLLTLAVTRHVHATPNPTPADRELWAWLTVLTVPRGEGVASLADMVATRHWHVRTSDELRSTA